MTATDQRRPAGPARRGPRTADQRHQDVAELLGLLHTLDVPAAAQILDRLFSGRDPLLTAALGDARQAHEGRLPAPGGSLARWTCRAGCGQAAPTGRRLCDACRVRGYRARRNLREAG